MHHLISFESMPWESGAAGQRFKSYVENGQQIRVMEITPKFEEAGWCKKGHIGYVLGGIMELVFEHDAAVLRPGDGFFIPEGDAHLVRSLTPQAKIVIVEKG
jgi:quercetin dioxygenase-like cupin family protein